MVSVLLFFTKLKKRGFEPTLAEGEHNRVFASLLANDGQSPSNPLSATTKNPSFVYQDKRGIFF